MLSAELKPSTIVRGAVFPEPVEVIVAAPFDDAVNRGFDLISRKPHPEDPKTAMAVRFIEVKGRAGVGDVALTSNEHQTAQRPEEDYWLYVVFSCRGTPDLHPIQDPARLGWAPIVKVEHHQVAATAILEATRA